ncbi:MAG: RagB/SusD family nutrient uptake outer membrane protein [Bacteroidales bacterium]|nr:RagB/SusD family nutrient uptake outer membrane protein [Bacteroidales bacterium]
MKKIFASTIAVILMASCQMEFFSSDTMTSAQLEANPAAAVYTTDGIYSLFKDKLAYKGQSDGESGNYYVRHYFQLAELRGDNVTISGVSTDPFCNAYRYEEENTTKNIYYTWWIGYKIINAANSNIDGLKSTDQKQLLGENYFFRAIAHFHLVTLFAKPYICGRDNAGIVLHVGNDGEDIVRASVGEVYDAVVADLLSAIDCMKDTKPRGDKGYVSLEAAKALLARVYLYMGEDDKCLEICDDLLGANPASHLIPGTELAKYPTHTYDSPETIWCVRHINPDDNAGQASIGSMYNRIGGGWGEHYWSDELIELFQRNPEDMRFLAYFQMEGLTDDGKYMLCFPYRNKDNNDFCVTNAIHGVTKKAETESYTFSFKGKSYTAEPVVEKEATRYYINGVDLSDWSTGAGKRTPVYIRPDVSNTDGMREALYVRYYNTKFSGQDGDNMLTSPVFLRWGEVVLNRAEARFKTGDTPGALEDVNVIRRRAGLPETAMFSETNMHGYTDVLDVILDERRMELCFEGHRAFDVFRNGRTLDRRYVGYHPWGTIDYTDNRIALLIPADEINSSHIEQNPR